MVDFGIEGTAVIKDPFIINSLPDWKKRYKNIFLVTIQGKEFVFRLLTKGEYKALLEMQKYTGLLDTEDKALKCSVLYPLDENLGNYLAGDIQSLVTTILDMSGFSDPSSVLDGIDYFRQLANTLDEQITCFICKAFPRITPGDVDKLDFPTLMRYLVLAEKILESPLNFQELKIQMAKARRKEEQGASQKSILAGKSFSWQDDKKETRKEEFLNAPPGDWNIHNLRENK